MHPINIVLIMPYKIITCQGKLGKSQGKTFLMKKSGKYMKNSQNREK